MSQCASTGPLAQGFPLVQEVHVVPHDSFTNQSILIQSVKRPFQLQKLYMIAKWLTGLQGDPPGCIRIGQITTHMNRTMWKQIQHQTAAEQQQTWTAVILIKESLCQIQVRRIKEVATIWHSMILNWTGQTKSWIISWFATSQAMHRFSSRCCSNWRIYWWLVLSAIHNPIAILCNPWN